jgi:hypothetical protein
MAQPVFVTDIPGFRVGYPETIPGFRVNQDGSVGHRFVDGSILPTSGYGRTGAAPWADEPSIPAGIPSDGGQIFGPARNNAVWGLQIENFSRPMTIASSDSSRSKYDRCLDLCYPILERPQPRGSDINKYAFHRCMARCMGE